MRINIVMGHALPFPPRQGGGIENINDCLSRAFSCLGCDVTVYSRAAAGLPEREQDANGVRHVRVPGFDWTSSMTRNVWNALRWGARLRRYMERAEATLFNTLGLAVLRHARLGLRCMTIQRTPQPLLRLFSALDRVYCPSLAVLEQAKAAAPGLRNLKMIYNCIDPASVERFGTPSGSREGVLFLYVGRFVRDKGVEPLVRGFEQTLDEFPDNQLQTIGPQTDAEGADQAFYSEMLGHVREGGLEDRIQFRPPIYDREQLLTAVGRADVVCVPTIVGETFSMAVLEAMALSKPILVSDFGPMPEAVDHRRNGYVAKAASAESIAEAVRFFSRQKHLLAEMGADARRKVERFAAARIAREFLEDFEAVLAQRRRAA